MRLTTSVLALMLLGCAARDEVIAVISGEGGAGGTGTGGGGPVVAFAPPVTHGPSCGDPTHITHGSVDGGSTEDLLITGGCLDLARGDGHGSFQAPELLVAAFGAHVEAGDVDGDGLVDVVGYGVQLAVYFGDGMGGVHAPAVLPAIGPGGPGSLSLADVAGDGAADLVTTTGHQVRIWLGDGAGGFTHLHEALLASNVDSHTLADVGGDGMKDVVVATGGDVAVLMNHSGTLAPPVSVSVGGAVLGVVAGALADGHDACADVVALDGLSSTPGPAVDGALRILINRCDGSGALDELLARPLSLVTSAALADIDGDGHTDIVATRAGADGAVAVFRGLGDGSVGDAEIHAVPGEPRWLTLADFDVDGRPDVAVASRGVGAVVLLNRTP